MKLDKSLVKLIEKSMLSEIFSNQTPLVIVFTAKWSSSCYIASTIVDTLAKDFLGAIKFFQIDIEEAGVDLKELGFIDVPLILFTRGDQVLDALQGIHSREMILEKIQDLLSPSVKKIES